MDSIAIDGKSWRLQLLIVNYIHCISNPFQSFAADVQANASSRYTSIAPIGK